jgi:predicted PurR-regulated permease PerM
MNQARREMLKLDISAATMLKALLIVAAVYFLYRVIDVLVLVFVAIIFATALEPAVNWLNRLHVPRVLSVLVLYLVIFLVLSLIIVLMVPPLIDQVTELARSFPYYYEKLLSVFSYVSGTGQDQVAITLQQTLQNLGANLSQATSSILSTLISIFGGIFQFVVLLTIAFYLVIEEDGIMRFIRSVSPSVYQPYIIQLIRRLKVKLGAWLRGQLLLMLIIAVLTYVGLTLLGARYALILALWAGVTEIIPYVGPILGAVPAVFLALSVSPLQALLVAGLYLVVQQLENSVIVPMVMRRTVGLNPVISIVAITIGAKLGGVIGAILSIPIAVSIGVFLSDFFDKRIAKELELEGEPPVEVN